MRYMYVVIRTALGGLSNNMSKVVMHSIPMYHFLIIRNILMLAISFSTNKSLKQDWGVITSNTKVRNSLILSATLCAVASVFFYQGLANLPVSIVSSVDNTFSLIAVTTVGVLFFKQRHSKKFYILLALLIPSASLLVITDFSVGLEVSGFGLSCLATNAILCSIETHLTKEQLKAISVKGNVLFKTFASLIFVVVIAIAKKDSFALTREGMSLLVAGLILYGAVNSLIIKLLHTKSIKEIGATVTTVFTSLTPVFSIIFALLIFKESLELTQWIGVGCTIVILYFITRVK